MKDAMILIFFLCLSLCLQAQMTSGPGKINGNLLTPQGEPISYATISLKKDTTLVGGCISDDKGSFKFEKLPPGEYTLTADFLGFEKVTKSILLTKEVKNVSFEPLTMSPAANQLDEVTITAEKSQYALKMDKKVFNVGKDVLAQGGTALDVLDQVPQVTVEPSGNVTLRGSSAVQILINGRRSGLTMNNAIDQIDMTTIDKIEVITNPSASFDANGSAGIINIVLKKNKFIGLKSQVRVSLGAPADHVVMPSFTYQKNKLNIFGNLRWRYSDYNGIYTVDQENRVAGSVFDLNKREIEDRHDDGLTYYFGGDYNFSPTSSMTLAYFRANTKDTDETHLNYSLENESGINDILRIGNSLEKRNYNQLESNFTHKFEEKGGRWTVDMQYDFWNSNKDWNLKTTGFELLTNVPEGLRTDNIAGSDDFVLQTDLSWPLMGGNFQTGVKSENRKVNNDYIAEANQGQDWQVFNGFANDLEYKERITAGYAEFQGKKDKLGYKFGVRGENSNIDIKDQSSEFVDNKKYFNFFPSAFLSYEMNETTTLQASYSRRINRPSLWDIYPFSDLTDINVINIGNPNLNPSYTNGYEMGMSTQIAGIQFNPGIYYRANTDAVDLLVSQNEDGVLTVQPVNIDDFNTYGFEFTTSFAPIKAVRMSADFNYFGFDQSGLVNGQSMDAKGKVWRTRGNLSIRPESATRILLSYQYRGPQKNAQVDYLSYSDLSASITRSFFNDVFDANVRVSNILDTRKQRTVTTAEDYSISSSSRRTGTRFSLNLTYKFNQKGRDRMRNRNRGNR